MKLLWREELSVGNNVIDADHKYLIEIINMVQQSLEAKDRAELNRLLDDLSNYSLVHFDREEKIANAAGYAQAQQLGLSHQALLKQLEQVRAEIEEMGQGWSVEVARHFTNFLRDWLINHVTNEDCLMKPLLEKFSPDFDAR